MNRWSQPVNYCVSQYFLPQVQTYYNMLWLLISILTYLPTFHSFQHLYRAVTFRFARPTFSLCRPSHAPDNSCCLFLFEGKIVRSCSQDYGIGCYKFEH